MPVLAGRERAANRTASAPLLLADVYRDHFDYVVRVARRIGGRALAAEDVAQEVFLVVGRCLDRYEPRAQLTTWLYRITFNVVRSMRRRLLLEWSYRADEAEGLEVPAPAHDPVELREAVTALDDILGSMSARKREVLLMGELDELPCAEIARLVGSKEATVWSRLHYARRELEEKAARWRQERLHAA